MAYSKILKMIYKFFISIKEKLKESVDIRVIVLAFIFLLPIVFKLIIHNGYLSFGDYESNFGLGFNKLYTSFFSWDSRNNGFPAFTSNLMSLFGLSTQAFLNIILPSKIADILILYFSFIFLFLSFFTFSKIFIKSKDLRFLGGIIFVYSKFVFTFTTFGWPILGIFSIGSALFLIYYFILFINLKQKKYIIISALFSLGSFITIQFSILSFLIIFIYILTSHLKASSIKSFCALLGLSFLINFWWIFPFFLARIFYHYNPYNLDLQKSVDFFMGLNKHAQVFGFQVLQPGGGSAVSLQNSIFSPIFHFIVFALFAVYLIVEKDKKRKLFFSVMTFIMLTLSFGGRSFLYSLLFRYFPLFFIFRDLAKFFPFLYIFLIIALLLLAQKFLTKINKKYILIIIFISFVSFSFLISWPLASGNLNEIIRPFELPKFYKNFFAYDTKDKMDGNILLLPVPDWFSGFEWNKSAYEMQNPLKNNLNSPTIFDEFQGQNYTKNQMSLINGLNGSELANFTKYFGLFNIKSVVLQQDQTSNTEGIKTEETMESYKETLFNKLVNYFPNQKTFGSLKVFYLDNPENFIPHIYTPKNVIFSKRNIDKIPNIVAQENYTTRSAIFLLTQNQNNAPALDKINGYAGKNSKPILEFKKINPTKYVVRIHQASEIFPLVFSENFHEGWRVYTTKIYPGGNYSSQQNILDNYQIKDENRDYQATKEELGNYITNNLISRLNARGVDFVSKNFQDTIQNNNLPDGHFWDTWFKKPIDNNNHLIANGYANSWTIDPVKLCSEKSSDCLKNTDGTYDFEIIIDFWPQRLFYVGLVISGFIVLSFMVYLSYDYRKRKKSER